MERTPVKKPSPINVPLLHWLWVGPLALFLRLWLSTLRVRTNEKTKNIEKDIDGNAVLILWHDRLFFAPIITQRYLKLPVCALVSASKDGAKLTAFYNLMGIQCARGSSNQLGAEALMTLARVMRKGAHAGITPDGPKGPRREFKLGALGLARVTKRPIVVMGVHYHQCWRLSSWDQFALPVPFSVVDLTLEHTDLARLTEEQSAQVLTQRLNELSGE